MRPEISEFKHSCDNLLGSAQQNDWALTEKERKVVTYYVQELQKRILPNHDDGQPLAMPVGVIPPIMIEVEFFSDNMGRGELISIDSEEGKWSPVAPGSIDKILWKIACGKP